MKTCIECDGRAAAPVRFGSAAWLMAAILAVVISVPRAGSAGEEEGLADGTTAAIGCNCDDGNACNGLELCNPITGACLPGLPIDCSGLDDQCNDGVCIEPLGVCVPLPKADGFGCDDGDTCTTNDVCSAGHCAGTTGADSDGDGFCDAQEETAHCDPDDPNVIPPQANVYSGGKTVFGGEILVTFNAPGDRDVFVSSDPTCDSTGTCDTATGFCTRGAVRNPCTTDDDCNQPVGTCRVVVNYADSPDLTLETATLKVAGIPKQDVSSLFLPITPGCSRKVDIALPSGFRRAKVKLKAAGTTSGARRIDRDKIRFKE